MGVENLGPFLYTFLRMTKKRRIVEIGAGFTSLWILQALKDNDEEIEQVKSLQETGHCKLLNIDWTIDSELKSLDEEPARLLCIDNCEHQKETATGASAVAKSLGLNSYFEFQRGDAFDLDLGVETVDALWCDFGVGARMKEFISSAWSCIRPGGFLICHSTLTNHNTRQWLEGIRNRLPEEETGIPPGEYVELSLLEPHKRFQNSVSILQKRKSSPGEMFEEPVYSQYA
jgi:predicted O-methyltransferase YrrM